MTGELRLQALLAEYSALRAEISARSAHQHQLIQLHVAAVTVILGASFASPSGNWIALALPLESSLFGLWWIDHAMTIQELSVYINRWSQGRLNSESGGRALMWEGIYPVGIIQPTWPRSFFFYLVVLLTWLLPSGLGLISLMWLLQEPTVDRPFILVDDVVMYTIVVLSWAIVVLFVAAYGLFWWRGRTVHRASKLPNPALQPTTAAERQRDRREYGHSASN